ncbi:hypothetical protein CASFOL_021131 [Castilleja foliolosa]|uniref:non-specific serine/threonine protein kinase n=1 Tax=Castilleja foliolosa TaxID=1961234 RepID=A0ABD3CWM9_9LAMI
MYSRIKALNYLLLQHPTTWTKFLCRTLLRTSHSVSKLRTTLSNCKLKTFTATINPSESVALKTEPKPPVPKYGISLQIAIDIASALEYLHHGHTFPIVHCDIKPSNVLLDEYMVAHLGDFGISKLFDDVEIVVQTKTFATVGYAAPEYGKVSTSGDVYSYGILLLELFTRKKPTKDMFNGEMSLKDWIQRALQENAVSEVVAPALLATEGDQHVCAKIEECASSIFSLAMKCLIVSPDQRINMIGTGVSLHKIKEKVVDEHHKK